MAAQLKNIDLTRERIRGEIDLKLLWESIADKDEAKPVETLASMYFGSDCDADTAAAMARALYADSGYFRPRGDGYFAVDEKTVKSMEEGRRREEEHRRLESSFIDWLQSPGGPPPSGTEKMLQAIKDYLVFGEQSPKFSATNELLKKAKLSDKEILFNTLEKVGTIQPDENLFLLKYHVPRHFSATLEEEALKLLHGDTPRGASPTWACPERDRLDLTSAYTITIDDASTRDIDDAISFETTDEGWRIGIHIADVAEIVPIGSPLDKEAHTRSTSIYLPDEKITMLPDVITEAASLKKGEKKPALSVIADFHQNGQLISWHLKETWIEVDERLTYDEVDARLENDPRLTKLHQFAAQFLEDRKKAGAVILDFPRIELNVNREKGEIKIEKAKVKTQSQILVSEWMVFANRMTANFCVHENIPTIYRIQDPPSKLLPFSDGDWVNLYRQRRFLRRGQATTDPGQHSGLGLPAYLQMTSPIRRYSDLVVHRQLKAFLRGQTLPYTTADLDAIVAYSERWIEISDWVERDSRRYWLLRYLERKTGETLDSVILENHPSEYLIYIPGYALEVSCSKTMTPLVEGDPLQVRLEVVKSRLGFLKVVPVS